MAWSIDGIIGNAMKTDSNSTPDREDPLEPSVDVLVEVARRATWDALYGPAHLRAGRFEPRRSEADDAGIELTGDRDDDGRSERRIG